MIESTVTLDTTYSAKSLYRKIDAGILHLDHLAISASQSESLQYAVLATVQDDECVSRAAHSFLEGTKSSVKSTRVTSG